MSLPYLHFLIICSQLSIFFIVAQIGVFIILTMCVFTGADSDADKKSTSIITAILVILGIINILMPTPHELFEILGGAYYTNSPKLDNPDIKKAIEDFTKEYDNHK